MATELTTQTRMPAPKPPKGSVVPYANRAPKARRRPKLDFASPVIWLMLASYAVLVIYPMFWLFYSSVKSDRNIFLYPFQFPHTLHWENFSRAWVQGQFQSYFANSVILTLSTVVITTFLSAMASYALARFHFRGVKPVYFYFLAGLMIPIQLAIVPLFFELRQMNLLDSLWGLFLVYLAFGFPFSIFILVGFFKSLPTSLHEAALLDGANEYQAFWHVMLPMAKPGLITVAIFLFLGNWNEYFVAFMCISGQSNRTLPLGLAQITIQSNYRSDWGMAFAGLVLMMLPALVAYIFLEKHLTKGITAGALKA
jgi:ABC-type glycerol-3-phosphate transport system permease component